MTSEISDRSGNNVTAPVYEYPVAMIKCWACIFGQKNDNINLFNIVVLHICSGSIYDKNFVMYTVFQKKWRQNSNHYNYGTPYQN